MRAYLDFTPAFVLLRAWCLMTIDFGLRVKEEILGMQIVAKINANTIPGRILEAEGDAG